MSAATTRRAPDQASPSHRDRPAPATRRPRQPWLLAALLVALGVALRAEQYLHRRSLWFDEALLSLNIVHRFWSRLLEPLAFHQGAPAGSWLPSAPWSRCWGSEYALRLVPFVGGCPALVVFAHLAHQLASRAAALAATVLFGLSPFWSTTPPRPSSTRPTGCGPCCF
jgi:hypothetical protein